LHPVAAPMRVGLTQALGLADTMRNRSIALGCFLAALAPGICLVSYTLLSGGNSGSFASLLSGALMVLAISFVVAAIPTLLLGLPYILWLRSRNALTWRNVCLSSALVGSLAMAVLTWAITWNNPVPSLSAYFLGAGLGLAGGVAFCLGARPNNSFKPNPLRGSA
jgi:hypothetical protein